MAVVRADRVYHLAAAVVVALIAKQPIQTIERNIYPTQLLLDRLGQRAALVNLVGAGCLAAAFAALITQFWYPYSIADWIGGLSDIGAAVLAL